MHEILNLLNLTFKNVSEIKESHDSSYIFLVSYCFSFPLLSLLKKHEVNPQKIFEIQKSRRN